MYLFIYFPALKGDLFTETPGGLGEKRNIILNNKYDIILILYYMFSVY